MQLSTTGVALVRRATPTRRMLVVLGLLALLVLLGIGARLVQQVSSHAEVQLATTNGVIHIGR